MSNYLPIKTRTFFMIKKKRAGDNEPDEKENYVPYDDQ
jgi:hypothetical protein